MILRRIICPAADNVSAGGPLSARFAVSVDS